jgi:diguanylate cyclase (GGDEF)-like protein
MLLDLDHFKVINDSLGHDVGDNLLIEVAKRLTACVREEDTVSRLGGDEFVVLLPELNKDREGAVLKAAHIAEKICKKLGEPILNDSHELHISVSIGIVVFFGDTENAADLIKDADNALYKAKDEGRNTYQFYTAEMKLYADSRLVIENELRHALEYGQLELYYQPQIDIQSNCIRGAEALLRWNHADKGLVSPACFIPVAEQTGLIIPIGTWVMKTACLDIAEWNKAEVAKSINYIAVNVSPYQFQQKDFVEIVVNSVNEAGIKANQLEVELTEGVLMHNIGDTLEKLKALKAFGVRIAIDDFGTGYSSLNYLKRFPLDVLKIDQSFVRDITTDTNDAAIVQTIISLANNLQLRVMAEGVETEEQLAFLRDRKCDAFQGYLCSRPVQKDAFIALLDLQFDR